MIEEISLHFKNAKSDKFYNVAIKDMGGDKFSVPFTYGRQGTAGQSGNKVSDVSMEVAKKAYDKVVKQKMGKGYKTGTSTTTISDTEINTDKTQTDILPQLLCPINESDIELYLRDDRYGAQEKKDGRRKFLNKNEVKTVSINKNGIEVGYPEKLKLASDKINGTFLIDGEEIGDILYVFDILSIGNKDTKSFTYSMRYDLLRQFLSCDETLRVLPLHKGYADKKKFYEKLKKGKKEGIVFKLLDSPYEEGRLSPNVVSYEKQCPQVKCKFYATASCIVTKVNEKRSVAIGLLDKGELVSVGNCAIPVSKEVPKEGIIEVRYLYAYKGGSLYQPIYLTPRDDVKREDCTIEQLKYKP